MQRRYIGSLGFSPQWNGQDYIRFDAHGNSDHYVPDGPYIAFSDWLPYGQVIDGAEDLSVILHEFGHALQDAFMPGTGSVASPYEESKIAEGTCDYLAVSYRRTLSLFQPDKVFPWFHNVTDIYPLEIARSLNNSNNFENNWKLGGNVDKYDAGITWASTLMDIQNAGVSRDIITKLFFTSCSFVSPSSLLQDHINAIFQSDRDIYEGSHLLKIFTAFNNRKAFYQDEISGAITSSTTWSGNKYVIGNVTVNSGVTLTISPNTLIFFTNGSSLIVNGTLTASGTSSQPITFDFVSPNSTTQNGIRFNSGSSGTINYCQIRNALYGIYENGVSINVTNSAISGGLNGIYLSNSSPTIQYCNIHDNANAGIYAINYSSPYLYNNYTSNNYYGVYCITNSNPKFGNGSTQGKNYLNNYCGVYCYNNSYPVLGKSSPLDGGYNNFVNAAQNIYNNSSGTVYANHIWWGTTNPSGFGISGSGTTSYTDYLTSSVTISPAPPLSKVSGDMYAAENKDIPMLSELDKAYELAESNNLTEARKVCMNLINNYPDYSVSYNALNLLKETYSEKDITGKIEVYNSLFTNKSKKDLYGAAGLILAGIDKENKLQHIEDVLKAYKGEDIIELALFDKFVYYYFDVEDKKSARTVSEELDTQFPKSIGAIEAHRILGDEEYFDMGLIEKQISQKTENTDSKDLLLVENYPNPFNPTTTISYALPQAGAVQIKIYDVLGREVAKLVDGQKSAGKYTVQWNGSNNASGVYFYSITFNNQSLYKKMLLIK